MQAPSGTPWPHGYKHRIAWVVTALATLVACKPGPRASNAPRPPLASAAAPTASADPAPNHDSAALVVHLSPSAASLAGLVEASPGHAAGQVAVMRTGSELALLEQLYDDARATAVLSAAAAGISVSGGASGFTLVARLADWKHGGEAPNPPPLTATRVITLKGVEPTELAAVVNLSVVTMLVEERRGTSDWASRTAQLKAALEPTEAVLRDRRASPDCRAPCQPWSWQTHWSVMTAVGRAKWQLGARLRDEALLTQSEALLQRALKLVPASSHPLTTAVSERLLGAALQSLAGLNDDQAVLGRSLAASERALAGFGSEPHRYDWALTQQNIQSGLAMRMTRSASAAAVNDALAASERVLSVLDLQTPNLHAQALLERARLLQSRWARSGHRLDLTESARLLQEAAATPGATAESLVLTVAGARCELESDVTAPKDDVAGLQRAVSHCEALAKRPRLPEESEPDLYRSYGLALARLAYATDDDALLARAVSQLERAIEAADRIEGRRAGVKTHADYAWGLLMLSRATGSAEASRKATSELSATLELISQQAAPMQWSQLKQRQGLALMDLGWQKRAAFQMEEAIRLYREARAAFEAALAAFAKEDNPSRWADLQQSLGQTWAREAESKPPESRALISKSVGCYERALAVSRREDEPEAYARAQFGLGSTYLVAAEGRVKQAAKDFAQRALAAFRSALETHQKSGNRKAVAHTKAHMADAVSILQHGSAGPSCEAAQLRLEAVAAYPHASGLWTSAQADLNRIDRALYSAARCPQLPTSFWQRAPEPKAKAKP